MAGVRVHTDRRGRYEARRLSDTACFTGEKNNGQQFAVAEDEAAEPFNKFIATSDSSSPSAPDGPRGALLIWPLV